MEFYLLEFRLKGIKNIEKEIAINFYKQDIRKFNRDNYNVKGIFGRNGIGKTAIIKGIEILRNIVLDNDYLILKNSLLNEMINKKLKKCHLSTEFLVIDEEKRKHIFEHSIDLKLDYFKNLDGIEKLSMNLLDRKSIVKLLVNDIVKGRKNRLESEKFEFIYLYVLYSKINVFTHLEDSHYKMVSVNFENQNWLDKIYIDYINQEGKKRNILLKTKEEINFLKKSLKRKEKFLKLFNPEIEKIEFEKKDFDEKYYEIEYIFCYKEYKINFEYESMGMKSLFRLFDVLDTVNNGGIVFVDEIDMSIHDLYLNRLIEFFAENGKGQFVFTAHNTSILDTLKKYKNSIDFVTEYQEIKPWIKNGNYSPRKQYLEGMLPNMPYNIEYYDFFEIFNT